MTTLRNSVCVKYSPKEMYDLVNDIRAYPRYLPLISEVRMYSETPSSLRATLTLAKGRIKFSFTTDNTMQEGREIRMNLVEGPFKSLKAVWTFDAVHGNECEATFNIEFEFANGLMTMAFGGFFKEVTESLVEAFCQQATLRYGAR
ncbi:type II toxin-antitoxin system RatA family toxin [Candidatus Woesearchaeota archaeon]|nr:type II toxin-antitoxin system RatA family toxin [Candidatus Woesearchaeota archaeon]